MATTETPTAHSGPSDRAIAQAFREISDFYHRNGGRGSWANQVETRATEIDTVTPPAGARDAVADAAVSLSGLAGVIRKHGTCAPSALEVVAERLEAALAAQPAPGVGGDAVKRAGLLLPILRNSAESWGNHHCAGELRRAIELIEALISARPAESVAQGGEVPDHQWFGPDPQGNWYVRTGAKWWYATPKTMITPEECGCLNEEPKPETTPTESPVNEARTECAPQAHGEIGTDRWNAQQEAQIAAYANHPALMVPCKHCGTVGMCPYPLACISAANKHATPTPATGSRSGALPTPTWRGMPIDAERDE